VLHVWWGWLFDLVFYAMRFGDWYMECGCWFRAVTWCDGHNGHMGGNGVLMCPGMGGWVGVSDRLGWLCER
jgi:hypothetical protein